MDAFPKPAEEVRVRTQSGGTLTVGVLVVLVLLFLTETYRWYNPPRTDFMMVDSTMAKDLGIYMDITFHSARCEFLETHTVDQADKVEHDFSNQARKFVVDEPSGTIVNPEIGEHYCGSCTGRGEVHSFLLFARQCCNTCEDMRRESPGLADQSDQCIREGWRRDPNRQQHCRVMGYLHVPKLAGNFHFGALNTSHTINSLFFGDYDPSTAGPLRGVTMHVPETYQGVYRYYIKIVPTIQSGKQLYQYAVSLSKDVRVAPQNTGLGQIFFNMGQPKSSVFFVYDFSPYAIERRLRSESFLHYVTNLCAIIGGVFSIFKIADSVIFWLQTQKK